MCGISGIITKKESLAAEFLSDSESLQLHRGPNSQNFVINSDGDWTIGLGHQRLSILDLSDAGSQPMSSASGNSLIIYNGEVYNYKELLGEYDNIQATTNTDTEVVIELIEKLGIENALNQFNGMWSLAYYNKIEQKIYLARDRIGIKPLYFYFKGSDFLFSSEIKSILSSPMGKFTLNIQTIGEYLFQSLQDSSPSSFFNEIQSIPPGCFAIIDLSQGDISFTVQSYWNIPTTRSSVSFNEAKKQTHDVFRDAVRLRMRSDVPVGVTLSGGIDSSAIASMMKEVSTTDADINIVSAVSPGSSQDESEFIDLMSKYLNIPVNKVTLSWDYGRSMELMQKATWHNDAPIASFSNIAHYLLMKKASDMGITVLMSGQGADELLCGYKKYLAFYVQQLLRSKNYFKAFKVLSLFWLNGGILSQFNFKESKRYLPSFWSKSDASVKGVAMKDYRPVSLKMRSDQSVLDRQIEDVTKFSVPYLTHYEDRMSMAWSREIRLPFLDYRLVELFFSMPTSFKLSNGWTKYIFRRSLESFLPSQISWRKDKKGFSTPQEEWMKRELKEEILNTFSHEALIFKLGLIDRDALLDKYAEFCEQKAGKGRIWYRDIFNPFALEVWLQQNKGFISTDCEKI